MLKSVKKAEQKVVNDPNANKVGLCAIRSCCFIQQGLKHMQVLQQGAQM